ncbi:AlpA family transcriptional regulator [Pseudomonas guariconensis]|uniref:AlpA family transcriptional regulator n=1 Tax=Pseudomonas guariconensis TaxID=1288410 RepID=UPI0018A89B71|nr:AlpA family transcriptional regulator [Pseudomonas guariconensis]MBF8740710.1 AlpA family transcriptional regulator [Pseudomonas guariconensis]MBF8749890.1 AlpA family transcriptional regulator [Pseudomonas guariconensis]
MQPASPAPLPADRHIMRRDEVELKTGFKRSHIYNLMKAGQFPQCRRIGTRAVGWDSLEIEQWVQDRLSMRD